MMQAVKIIKELRSTTGRIEKEQILKDAFMRGERDFFAAARLCLSPFVTFGVKKIGSANQNDGSENYTFKEFLVLCSALSRRELSGHAAKAAINRAILSCDVETWNSFYRPVLSKDLDCGVERSTFNKCLEYCAKHDAGANDYLIPVFGVQLAKDGADQSNTDKLVGRKLLDMKLDGMRFATILNKEDGSVTQWTRSGHQNENFPQLCAMLEQILPELPCSMVLDGEVISETFQHLMTQARRKKNPDTSDAKLALFDLIPLVDFQAGLCRISQEQRHEMLCELDTSGLLQHVAGDRIYVVPKKEVDLDTEQGQIELREFRQRAAELKFEGVMVKDPLAGYVNKRSAAWLKIKPTITVDLTVVDLIEGQGARQGSLGAMVCEGVEDGKKIRVSVGSGFSVRDGAAIWADPRLALGQTVEIEADAITKSEGKDAHGLRFPTLKRFRSVDRVPGEKD